jgi:hypothetical protein
LKQLHALRVGTPVALERGIRGKDERPLTSLGDREIRSGLQESAGLSWGAGSIFDMEFFEPDRCYAGQAFFLWGESRLRRDRTEGKRKIYRSGSLEAYLFGGSRTGAVTTVVISTGILSVK